MARVIDDGIGMGEGFCGYSAGGQGVKQKYVKANPSGYDFIQAINPNDVQELVRIYMENNGIAGLKKSIAVNHEMTATNKRLLTEVDSLKDLLKRERNIVDALLARREDY